MKGQKHERTLDELIRDPVTFRDAVHAFDPEHYQRCQSIATPYYQAYHRNKEARLSALQELCRRMNRSTFVVSTFNTGFTSMLANWAASCDRHHIDCRAATILFPMDKNADHFARGLGFETYYDGASYGDLPTKYSEAFGDADFVKCMFIKTAMIQDLLLLGYDVLLHDIDMVWFKDPLPYLQAKATEQDHDFLFMYDGINPLYQPLYYNSGFAYIKNNEFSRYTWQLVFDSYDWMIYYASNQVVVNIVINALRERGLRTHRLAEHKFVNGHVVVKAIKEGVRLAAPEYVVHMSWTANLTHKVERFKQHGMWYLQA